MDPQARIFIAGHRGLVGSAIVRRLESAGCRDLILRSHTDVELTDQAAADAFLARERPQYVFLAAARVGGILANDSRPAFLAHADERRLGAHESRARSQ